MVMALSDSNPDKPKVMQFGESKSEEARLASDSYSRGTGQFLDG